MMECLENKKVLQAGKHYKCFLVSYCHDFCLI